MKRAQVPVTVYFRIFEIILLVLVISIVIQQVTSINNSGIYQKKFLSRDLALVMDSLTNARGSIWYTYNPPVVNTARFDIDFSNGRVDVEGDDWPYAINNNYKIKTKKLDLKIKKSDIDIKKLKPGAAGLIFLKDGDTISVEKLDPVKTPSLNGLLLECPVSTTAINSFIIDPGHGYNEITQQGEKGLAGELKDSKGKQIPESELMLKIGVALESQLKDKKNILSTRSLEADYVTLPLISATFLAEEAKTTKERIDFIVSHDSAVISLHTGKYDKTQNIVKAFINKNANIQTKNLACSLVNSLAARYPFDITGTAIVPVDLTQLSPDDPKQVLLEDKTVVQLELGNLDYPNNKLLQKPQDLATALKGGMS